MKSLEEPVLIDVFGDGKIITRAEAQELSGSTILEEHLLPAKEKDILIRMLYNLLNVAEIEGDRSSMIRYLDAIVAIDQEKPSPRAMRSMLLYSEGRKGEALRDLEWIVTREPEGIDLIESEHFWTDYTLKSKAVNFVLLHDLKSLCCSALMIKRNDKSGAKKFRKELKRKKVAKAMARAGKGVGGAKD